VSKKQTQNIFHHNSNNSKHIYVSKLITVIDNYPPHLIIFEHYLVKPTASYNWLWPSQQLIGITNDSLFYWTKSLFGYYNFCSKCPPCASMQACNLQHHWLIASLTVLWLNRANSSTYVLAWTPHTLINRVTSLRQKCSGHLNRSFHSHMNSFVQ